MAARSPAIPRVYDDFDQDDTRLDPAALFGTGGSSAGVAGRRSTGTALMPAAQALVDQMSFVQAAPPIVRVRQDSAPTSGIHRVDSTPFQARQVEAIFVPGAPAAAPAAPARRGLSTTTAVLCGVIAGLVGFAVILLTVRALS